MAGSQEGICFGTYIAAADARVPDLHDDIVSVFDFGDGSVLEVDLVRFLKDKGRILYFVNFPSCLHVEETFSGG
jgi:hypothetical protein